MSTSPHTPSHDDGPEARPSGRSTPGGHGAAGDHDAPGPLSETSSQDRGTEGPRGEGHRIDPARMEVRVRRIALAGLVLVPLVYFIVQSLR